MPLALTEKSITRQSPRSVAVIADYPEENWPSMDLVAKMLAASTSCAQEEEQDNELGQLGHSFKRHLIQPRMALRFSRDNHQGNQASTLDRILGRFYDYPSFLRKNVVGRYDLYHVTDHSYSHLVHSLPAKQVVVTCHDLDTFQCLWDNCGGRGTLFKKMTKRILDGLLKAAHVCCDTHTIRDELVSRFLVPIDKTSVVSLGVNPCFYEPPSQATVARIESILGCDGTSSQPTYLLNVGSTIPRKRIDVLLNVFHELLRDEPSLRLLRVGGSFTQPQQDQVRRLGIGDKIQVLPFLNEAELSAIYRKAAFLLQPTGAEGFCLPIVEALACGTPVLASDIPVLREVGSGMVTFARVGEVSDWVGKASIMLLEYRDSPGQWAVRQRLSRERARRFSWGRTAVEMCKVYEKVLASEGIVTSVAGIIPGCA